MFKLASLSNEELSLLKELEGKEKNIDEFRTRLPRFKELERLLRQDHLKDFTSSENQAQYNKNTAMIEQGFKSAVTISQIDDPRSEDGMPPRRRLLCCAKGTLLFRCQSTRR
jgi:hypothetical protein